MYRSQMCTRFSFYNFLIKLTDTSQTLQVSMLRSYSIWRIHSSVYIWRRQQEKYQSCNKLKTDSELYGSRKENWNVFLM